MPRYLVERAFPDGLQIPLNETGSRLPGGGGTNVNVSCGTTIRRSLLAALVALQRPSLAAAGEGATPLIDKVRNATARYVDLNVASWPTIGPASVARYRAAERAAGG